MEMLLSAGRPEVTMDSRPPEHILGTNALYSLFRNPHARPRLLLRVRTDVHTPTLGYWDKTELQSRTTDMGGDVFDYEWCERELEPQSY